jgi:hypothetical protein
MDHGSRYNMVYVSNTFSRKNYFVLRMPRCKSGKRRERKIDSVAIGTATKYEINDTKIVRAVTCNFRN